MAARKVCNGWLRVCFYVRLGTYEAGAVLQELLVVVLDVGEHMGPYQNLIKKSIFNLVEEKVRKPPAAVVEKVRKPPAAVRQAYLDCLIKARTPGRGTSCKLIHLPLADLAPCHSRSGPCAVWHRRYVSQLPTTRVIQFGIKHM